MSDPALLVVSKGVCVCTTSPVKIDTPEIWPSFKERGTSIYRGTGFLVTIQSFEVERLQKRLEADRTRRTNGVLVENVARGPKGDCKGRFKWFEVTLCIGRDGKKGLVSGKALSLLVMSRASFDEHKG